MVTSNDRLDVIEVFFVFLIIAVGDSVSEDETLCEIETDKVYVYHSSYMFIR